MEHGVYIDGHWLGGGRHIHVIEKYTGRHLAAVTRSRSSHVAAAVTAAHRVMQEAAISAVDRAHVLALAAQRLSETRSATALLLAKETGKPLMQSYAEVDQAVAALGYGATLASTGEKEARLLTHLSMPLTVTRRNGRGVTAIISSRIDPLATAAAHIGTVFAAGNSCIMKPSTHTPLTTMLLCRTLAEAGMPPGWVNVLVGSGRGIGERLLRNEHVACAVVSGTDATVSRVAELMKDRPSFATENRGAAAAVIYGDADVDVAVDTCIRKAFAHSGQGPLALERIYVHDTLQQSFTAAFKARVNALVLGDPLAGDTDVACMMDPAQADRISSWVDEALRAGAQAMTPNWQRGNRVSPTVVTDVPDDCRLLKQQLAGPVVTLHPFSAADHAVFPGHEIGRVIMFTRSADFTQDNPPRWSGSDVVVYARRNEEASHAMTVDRQCMDELFRKVSVASRLTYYW